MDIAAITIPIFIFVILGYILRAKGIIDTGIKDFLSKVVYYFAFPALTFRSIVSFDFARTFRLKLVAANLSTTCVVFAVTFFLAFLLKDARRRGAFNMSCFRSNQGYMGLPVISGFYGNEAMSRAAIVNGFDSPTVIILSVLAMEIYNLKNQAGGRKQSKSEAFSLLGRKLLNFVTNPFILSSLTGLFLSYFRIPVLNIKVIDEFLNIAGGMALPLALISIGCSIEVKQLKNNLKLTAAAVAIKLAIMPVIGYMLAFYAFGLRGVDLGMSVILLSTPTSVSSCVMAREMGSDEELSANVIGVTTFISVLSISLIQYILKNYFL